MSNDLLNLKKADALEFVQSLPGGWDCIIWNPNINSLYKQAYYEVLAKEIIKKANSKKLFWIEISDSVNKNANYHFGWYPSNKFIDIQRIGPYQPNKKIIIENIEDCDELELFTKLFQWSKAVYILDPFTISGNSIKACKNLGIKIDNQFTNDIIVKCKSKSKLFDFVPEEVLPIE